MSASRAALANAGRLFMLYSGLHCEGRDHRNATSKGAIVIRLPGLRTHLAWLRGAAGFPGIANGRVARGLVRDQERVLELIASGLPLVPSLDAVIALVEGQLAGGHCSVLLRAGDRLRMSAATSLPQAFRQLVDDIAIAEGSGVCGTAAFRRATVVVKEIRTDPLTAPWRDAAAGFGYKACWSAPVLASSGEVLGTFAIYLTEPRRPRPHELAMVDSAVRLARVAIERAMAEEARHAATEELARTNRSLQVLSRCNEALMRVEDERELLLEICRLAVDVGGYRMVWVGYARDDEQRSIVPMAHAGHEEGYLSQARLTWDENVPMGQGPAGRTIRSGQMVVAEDVQRPEHSFYWRRAAMNRGLRSLICLPLRSGTRTFGLLALYSGEVHRAGEAEVKLLGELADNLAFGIGNLHARLERNRAQEEVRLLNDELEGRVRRRTAQLEEANRELEAFSYSVSHDLRTPLSAIDGFSGMLEKAAGAQLGEQQRHYLGRIRAGVHQMGDLIDDLLSLAQVSRASIQRETVDIGAMARKVFDSLREQQPGRAAQIDIEPGLLARGDWRLLMRVVENLAGNAWKFTSREPVTRISVGGSGSTGPNGIFFIRDNGAGFDMAYAEKLFGTFQRLHTAAEFPGTGIGLATVHRIVTRHGGQVWAESAPGEGAVFYFSLPVAEEAGDPPHSL